MPDEPIRVVVSMDFSDEIMAQLRSISTRLQIERHFPKVPDSAYAAAEIMYLGGGSLPTPDQVPHLRWIQLHHAGANRVLASPIGQAEDVEITTASGVHATPIAEYCLAMMLSFAYRLPAFRRLQDQARWPDDAFGSTATHTLREQTLGIVGYGSIGRELARLANSLGMEVVASKRDLKQLAFGEKYAEDGLGDVDSEIPNRLYPPEALASMVSVCDYVVLTLPLTDDTRHVVDEAILNAMKPSAVLINVSRGAIIDEAALISALAAEQIAGAGLDVFEQEPLPSTSPLWEMDNVIITPHISGNTARYHELTAALFAENLQRYLDNQPLLNLVERERGY